MGSETFCFLTDASLREDKTSLFAQNTARLTQILTPSVKHTWAVKDFIVRKSFCGYSRHSFEKISSGQCFEKMLVWEKMRPSFSQYSCLCLFYDRRTGSRVKKGGKTNWWSREWWTLCLHCIRHSFLHPHPPPRVSNAVLTLNPLFSGTFCYCCPTVASLPQKRL